MITSDCLVCVAVISQYFCLFHPTEGEGDMNNSRFTAKMDILNQK